MPVIPLDKLAQLSSSELLKHYSQADISATLAYMDSLNQQAQASSVQRRPEPESPSLADITPYNPSEPFFSETNLAAMGSNIIPSAIGAAEDAWQTVRHPIQTFDAAREAGVSGLWEGLKQRYGNIKKTAVEDPVGLGMDIASVAAPIGSFAGRTGILRRIGRVAQKAERLAPSSIISGLGKAAVELPGRAQSEILSITSGRPARAISTALEQQWRGTNAARKAFGDIVGGRLSMNAIANKMDKVVSDIRREVVRQQKTARRALSMEKVPVDTNAYLDMVSRVNRMLIDDYDAVLQGSKISWKNSPRMLELAKSKKVRKQLDEAYEMINQGNRPPITLAGVDNIKLRLDMKHTDLGSRKARDARAVIDKMRAEVRSLLSDETAHPVARQYNDMMAKHADLIAFREQLEAALATRSTDIDATINKLARATNEAARAAPGTLARAEQMTGVPLNAMSAAIQLEQLGASGLVGRSRISQAFFGAATIAGGAAIDPTILIALPLASPKVVARILQLEGLPLRAAQPLIDIVEFLWTNPYTRTMGQSGMNIGAIINRVYDEADIEPKSSGTLLRRRN